MARPANTAPFKKYHHALVRYLYEHCIVEETKASRLYFPSAWAWWLMFDLQESPVSQYGWRMCDYESVLRYIKPGYLLDGCEHKPPHNDWKVQSVIAMINAGVLLSNCRNGQMRKVKESRLIERYWYKIDSLMPAIDKNKIGPMQSNSYLSRRVDNLERILLKVCGLVGLDEFKSR